MMSARRSIPFLLVVAATGALMVLCCPAPVSASLATSDSVTMAGNSYWEFDPGNGFLAPNKAGACLHASVQPLCGVLRSEQASNSTAIEEAAASLEADDVLQSGDAAVLEDAHHLLAVAACRIGYNSNPSGRGNGSPIQLGQHLSGHLLRLSKMLRRAPTVSYTSLVLDNCVKTNENVDPTQAPLPSLDDWLVQRTVSNRHADKPEVEDAERGFYAAHCAAETVFTTVSSALAKAVAAADTLAKHSDLRSDQALSALQGFRDVLLEVSFKLRQVVPLLKRMRAYINPDEFMDVIRGHLKCGDTMGNGIIFAGTEGATETIDTVAGPITVKMNEPILLPGPTGAMTSTMAYVDAALGIRQSMDADPELNQTMNFFRKFHPIEHATAINDLWSHSGVRTQAMRCHDASSDVAHVSALPRTAMEMAAAVVDAYDDAIVATTDFRIAHVDHVLNYILRYVPSFVPVRDVTGTGGTPIASYLCRSAMGTLQAQLGQQRKGRPSFTVPPMCVSQCVLERLDKTELGTSPMCQTLFDTFRAYEIDVTFRDARPSSGLPNPTAGGEPPAHDEM